MQEIEFDQQVIEFYTLMGHRIEHVINRDTNTSDLIIQSDKGEKWIARCKKSDVNGLMVHDFIQVVQSEGAKLAAIITPGITTSEAVQLAKDNHLYLFDGNQFQHYLQRARRLYSKKTQTQASVSIKPSSLPVTQPPHSGVRKCPYCGKQIQEAAVVCTFCGKNLYPQQQTLANPNLPTTPSKQQSDPHRLDEFVGQEEIKSKLSRLIEGSRKKNEPLHHILLCGQPDIGKLVLAKVIANEMGVNLKIISGDKIERAGDFAAILTNLRAGDILTIEQIEAMRKPVVEVLIQSAEDFSLDVIFGKGPARRQVNLKLPRFTVVGITSKPSLVDKRISGLFFVFNFAPYNIDEMKMIISRSVKLQGTNIPEEVINFLAERCNGCPGEAMRALKKVRNYATAYSDGVLNSTIAREALTESGINDNSPINERLSIPDDVKMFVWQRDGGRCVKCGSQENLEFDHIIPVSKGGSNTARNIQLFCEKCNRSKGGNIT